MSSDNDQHPPTASNTGGDSSRPAAPPRETKEDTINKWLRLVYIDREHLGNPLALTVDEFINILATGHEYGTISWLDNNALELATVILTNVQKERSDIVIVPSSAAIRLAHIGLCMSGADVFKEDNFSIECYDAMLNESVRWIVVPVTDGMVRRPGKENRNEASKAKVEQAKRTKERNEKAQEAGVELVQEQDKMLLDKEQEDEQENDKDDKDDEHGSLPDAIPGGGMHWGLMIIDKQKSDARWLDGHLTLEKKKSNGKWYIRKMCNAGWVAGKILCGYEKVMNLERGRFTAATLKHVPHDTKNNSYQNDKHSACGPWVFAMLEYILGHPQYLTCEGGLYSTFRPRDRRGHNHRMAFDSLASRRRIQEVIESEADRDSGDDQLPYKMSVRVLKSLNYPSTADLLGVTPLGRRREPPPRRGQRGSSGKKPGNDDDDGNGGGGDDNDPGTQGPILDDDNNPEFQQTLLASLQENQEGSAQGPQESQDPTKSNNPPKPPSKPTSSRPPTFNLATHGPMLATHIPHFASMASNQIPDWIGLLPKGIEKLAKPRNDWDQKAVLQKFFGGFDGLSESQKRFWLEHDPLFKGNDRVNIENVPEMLKERVNDIDGVVSLQGSSVFYPPSYLEDFAAKNSTGSETLEAGTKPAEENSGGYVDNPDDGAGENLGDDGNNSNPNGEAEENDPIPPQTTTSSGQLSGVGTHKRKHANEDPDAPETKRQRLLGPNFLRMEPSELLPWLESVPDDKKASLFDKERNLIDPISARINLERTFNDTFRIWAEEDEFSETTRKELKEWRKMVVDKKDLIASTYLHNDNDLRSFLHFRLNRPGKNDWPDYSKDEAKWTDCWKKRKE